ncbi:hypothetical protein I5E97_11170 [Proteus hauseri]|nr:hypothetical protein [Proteus hauseri]MBG6031604.1 hypothetical protein [Proteus hauseri]MBS6211476.1 hypothetical protein [Proteus hauseri]
MNITPISFIENQQSIKDNEIKNLFDIFDIRLFNNDSLSFNLDIAKNQINELADSVRNGSSKDLDYLVNIMFHDDIKISLYATNQLYLIYSKLNNSIRRDIKELIKSLYEIKVRDDKEYFKERPLLSAMACGDAIAGQQGKGNNVFISAIDNYLNMKCNDSVLVNSMDSVSSSNRYISSSELQSWVSFQPYQCDIGHYETILKKIENDKKSDELKNYVVLVNNNHWVALFTYKDSCFLCDSLSSNKEDNDERYKLLTRLKEKGFNTFNIEDNLQKNVPNGCGLFALNYIDNLQNKLNKLNNEKVADLTSTIETVLQNTGKIFLNQSDDEQAVFNHHFRKKLIMDALFHFVKSSNE